MIGSLDLVILQTFPQDQMKLIYYFKESDSPVFIVSNKTEISSRPCSLGELVFFTGNLSNFP